MKVFEKTLCPALTLVAMLVSVPAAFAADVSMTAGDGFGASSFNSAGFWNDALAPSAGNNYFNAGFLLRTPANTASHTFAGDALTITGLGLAAGANNEALMWKGSGTAAIITVNNLTINGGQLRHGQGSADTVTWAGSLAVGPNGANFAAQGGMIVNSSISGSSTIRILDSGNTDAARLTTFGSGVNTFTGDIELSGSAANRARIALADNANLNFVIGASGVNNRIFGTGTATLSGDFNFDLTGASTTFGDSWTIVSAAARTFNSTFSVAGFTDIGTDRWAKPTGVGDYFVFDEATGVLAVGVPEPGSATLLLAGAGMLLGFRRTRRA